MPEPADVPDVKTVVVTSATPLPSGTRVVTPAGMPDLIVRVVTPVRRTIVRVLRVYVQSLSGLLPLIMGGQTLADVIAPGQVMLPAEFIPQMKLAMVAALAPSTTALLGNLLELLIKWDDHK